MRRHYFNGRTLCHVPAQQYGLAIVSVASGEREGGPRNQSCNRRRPAINYLCFWWVLGLDGVHATS